MLGTRRSCWTTVLCALLACIVFTSAQKDCEVTYQGELLTAEQWQFGITIDEVSDTAEPGIVIEQLQINKVKGVDFEAQDIAYLDLNQNQPLTEIGIKLTDLFPTYEDTQDINIYTTSLNFVCSDDSAEVLPVLLNLVLTNNHVPEFENKNNAGNDGYQYQLPMPFPRGISITTAFNEIYAFDVDIGNTNVTFTLNDPSDLFEVFWDRKDDSLKSRHYANIRAKERLDMTDGVNLDIIATDSEGRTVTAPIRMDVDQSNSDPLPDAPTQFDSVIYTVEITDTEMPPGPLSTNAAIVLKDYPAGDITVVLTAAPGIDPTLVDLFAVQYAGDGVVQISLDKLLTEEAKKKVSIVVVIKASQEGITGFEDNTVIHIQLPMPEECEVCETCTTPSIPTEKTTPPTVTEEPGTCPPCPSTTVESPTSCPTCPPSTCPSDSPYTCPSSSAPSTCPTCEPSTCLTCAPNTCPTCPPYTTIAPPPPISITFDQPSYATAVDATYTGPLFTVSATLAQGVSGAIAYGFDPTNLNEEVASRLEVNRDTGEVSLQLMISPGSYMFSLTATLVDTDEVARALGVFDVASTAECVDGSTCYPNAVMLVTIAEGEGNNDLIPGSQPLDPSCTFDISEEMPSTGWFTLNKQSGQLGISDQSDCESELFMSMPRAEMRLRLRVTCGDNARPGALVNSSMAREIVRRDEMLVFVTLTPVNEDLTLPNSINVAYPKQELARQLLPGPIAVIMASSNDAYATDMIHYELASADPKFSVHPDSGYLYPVDGKFDYKVTSVQVLATRGALRTVTTVQMELLDDGHVAVLTLSNAVLEDVEEVLKTLNDELDNSWGAIKSSVVAEDVNVEVRAPPALKHHLYRAAAKAGSSGGLFMVVYALDNERKPVPYTQLKESLESLEVSGTQWEISEVVTWVEAGGGNSNGGGGVEDNSGLEAAVISLGVITGVLIIVIIVIVYLTVFRKKHKDKMAAKSGFKNRTSFSKHKESIAVENGKNKNMLQVDWNEKIADEERRKSMVTFNDEPEVIPVIEQIRL